MTTPAPIIAVLVAWNGGQALDRCVESLRRQHDGTLILVDNGSSARERERLEGTYTADARVRFLPLRENQGFAGGANHGLRAALAAGAGSVLLLTQDVVLEDGCLAELSAALEGSRRAGIVGPLVLDSGESRREISRGERFWLPLICVPRTLLRYRSSRDAPYEVSGLLGCALLLSRDVLSSTGGFDPGYFAYYEEVDLCLRARRLGYSLLVAPRACVRHDGWRGFAAGFTPLSAELKARNLIRLVWKLGGPLERIVFLPGYVALLGSSALLYAVRGRVDILRALGRGARSGWEHRQSVPASHRA